MIRPGRILERDEVATPRGSPVTVSKGVLLGIVHYCSDLKELRPSFGSRCEETSITFLASRFLFQFFPSPDFVCSWHFARDRIPEWRC